METVKEFIESGFMKYQALPDREEIEKAGIDVDTYVSREKAWYDASIRAMDLELGRLLEHLQHLGLDENTMIVFMSDHGEEFLEHGRHFHGYNAYGEMLNVPLIVWWPAGIPGGQSHRDYRAIHRRDADRSGAQPVCPFLSKFKGQSLLAV